MVRSGSFRGRIGGNILSAIPYISKYIEGAGVLIDPASDRKRLVQLRETQGVKMVWLSHWHEDHLKHLDLFDDLPLWISEKDSSALSSLETFLDCYGIDYHDYREYWRKLIEEEFHYKPRKPTQFLKGGQIMDVFISPGNLKMLFSSKLIFQTFPTFLCPVNEPHAAPAK